MTYRLALCALIAAALVFSSCGDEPCDEGDECTIIDNDDSESNNTNNSNGETGNNSTNAQNDASNSNDANGNTDNQSTNGEPTTRDGLEGFCDHYKTCGGSTYDEAQDCIDESIDYWGECAEPALDEFGDCMMNIDCDDWNPDTYNPSNTDCADEWDAVSDTDC